jgi:hypothetical protein
MNTILKLIKYNYPKNLKGLLLLLLFIFFLSQDPK